MPRRKQILNTGEYYHIFNRGVNKCDIFKFDTDYKRTQQSLEYHKFTDRNISFCKYQSLAPSIKEIVKENVLKSEEHIKIIAYCLMPNHFHLIVQQNVENGIMIFVRDFQNSLSRNFNIKYNRVGPLFQNRYKSVGITSDAQLMHVVRYVHLNPYVSGIVSLNNLHKYKWSSYPDYLYGRSTKIVNKETIMSYFSQRISFESFTIDHAESQYKLGKLKID